MALNDLSDEDFAELYGVWTPHTPQDAAELLDGYGGRWWVVGGWAAQAFSGVTRSHEDVDIAIRRGDLGMRGRHGPMLMRPPNVHYDLPNGTSAHGPPCWHPLVHVRRPAGRSFTPP